MQVRVACVVEGHGDTRAVPVLVRRIAAEVDPALSVHIPEPVRVPRYRLVKAGELERAVVLATRKLSAPGAVLILVDSEDDCPRFLGPALLQRAALVYRAGPVAVVLAKYEFEAWFLAAAESLRGRRGLPSDIEAPPHPERIRAAKGWLASRMAAGQTYSETQDQAAFAAVFDLQAARRAGSFDKCYRDIVRILTEPRS